ncbi:hypothetical protein [Brevifollis gellanilyticus]|uniref:SLA1 homology domain-containing protein n=1 Tax=Brevifollis gellanilyticus TaxID=748831 RepID=A0A512M846_9BACT|nr:hypothetical protein [Brevifollis gellanilyticus]GEP42904.1 hypothetical protein BGE01nite_21950 [Brevifollis gellanilyticus]
MKTHCLIALLLLAAGTSVRAQDAAPADGSAPAAQTPPEGGTTTIDAPAADQPPAAEEDGAAIPIAYDMSRYDSVWENNPFTRKVVPPAPTENNWGQDWALAGMFSHNGKIRVSIRNKQTNELKRITNEPKDGDEFKLVHANFNRSRKEASAELEKDGKTATLKYDENAAPVTINNTARPAGGGAGQQGVPGAQALPGRPGGQPMITKPLAPQSNGRVFNAPNLPGGMSAGQAGMVPGMGGNPATAAPMANGQVVQPGMNPNLPGNVPTISRRRQLIPAPVVAPQGNP